MMLRSEEINMDVLKNATIFHFGTLSMTEEQVAAATKTAVQKAKEAGSIISFDPNLRPPLWKSLEMAKKQIWYGISQCDILKISDDEIAFLTGTEDIDIGISRILKKYQPSLICATMGRNGSKAYFKGKTVFAKPFLREDTVETTGAGDTFMACVLNTVLEKNMDDLTEEDLSTMLEFANGASSIITTRKGALKVMPQKQEILALLKERKGE